MYWLYRKKHNEGTDNFIIFIFTLRNPGRDVHILFWRVTVLQSLVPRLFSGMIDNPCCSNKWMFHCSSPSDWLPLVAVSSSAEVRKSLCHLLYGHFSAHITQWYLIRCIFDHYLLHLTIHSYLELLNVFPYQRIASGYLLHETREWRVG